jgi:hypothetical protein
MAYDPNNPFQPFNTSPMSLLNVGGFRQPGDNQGLAPQNVFNQQQFNQNQQSNDLKRRQQLGNMLLAFSDVFRGKDPSSGVLQRQQLFRQQQEEERRKKLREEYIKQNPQMAEKLSAIEAGIPYQLLDSQRQQQYKPELVEFKNTSDESIKIGNFVIQPGQQMPFNVAIPEIANAISGVPGLKEVKDKTVYTRQGNTYLTESGNYKEIVVGDRRIFDGPTGQLSSEEFFARYPEARMTTSGEEQRYIPDFKTFTNLNKELVTEEKSLKQILSYWENIKDSNIGIERLGDQMATWFKTLAGSQNLTTQELARSIAEGKLQGLIGANRIDTVGGGVMTEKDAWRVIARLGGDVDALQNPATVGPLLEEMFKLKVETYNEDIKGYNLGVESGKYEGYEKRTPITQEEITSKFSLLPEGVPAGSIKIVRNVNGTDVLLYQKGEEYYFVNPDGTVQEVDMEQ